MKRLQVAAFGPIENADVTFGDLTILVGPQATGKSLFGQLYKFIEDGAAVTAQLERYGFDWKNSADPVGALGAYYWGSGKENVVSQKTEILQDDTRVEPSKPLAPDACASDESVVFIPAQRGLLLRGGAKPMVSPYDDEPYVLRHFGESIRAFLERMPDGEINDLMSVLELRMAIDAEIYDGAVLALERVGAGRRIVLKPPGRSMALPFAMWSTGQREFTPMLLGLAALASEPASGQELTIILEKPEMGLHPQAVLSVGLLLLDLLARNYRLIVSTHSPLVLDLVWAIRELSAIETDVAIATLCRIFNLDKPSPRVMDIFAATLQKEYRTYFFNRTDSGVVTEDISTLDPGDANENVAGWGGLSGVSGRIARLVGEARQ